MLTVLGALPFFLYVTVFLLLPIGVLAVEAFRATDPVTFEESWSTDSIVAVTEGAYRRAYLGSLQLSAITAVLGAVLGLALAVAILRAKRGRLLRRLVLTASGVLANFGGIPLAFAFLATIGTAGVVTALLQDTLGLGLGGFSLYSMAGLALVYLYFLIPLMVLTITPALEALRPQWREAADNLGASGWQIESLGGRIYRLSGKTQPGATVRAQDKQTFATGDGSFLLQITSPSTQTTVEISDERGNRSSFVLNLTNGRVVRQF